MTAIPKEERRKYIGASEVAALFGVHPQISKFELWHRKAGNIPEPDLSSNERVYWGNQLESAIAHGFSQQMGWKIRKVHRYIEHPLIKGMGASLDFEIVDHKRGPAPLEIKTVDWLQFRNWPDGEPPLNYMLQLQHQMAVTKRDWGVVGVLVGGNEAKPYYFERHPGAIAKIESAVADFWDSIRENKSPKPDFEADCGLISNLYSEVEGGKVLDLSQDNRFVELCHSYIDASEREKAAKKDKDAAKAEMITKIEDAERIFCGDFSISAKYVADIPETTITTDMVGQTIGGRKGYRNLRLTQTKSSKKEAA